MKAEARTAKVCPERGEAGLTVWQRATLKLTLKLARERLAWRYSRLTEASTRAGLEAADECERALLRRIDDALLRFERGDYGLDVETGEAIGFARLSAIPWETRIAKMPMRDVTSISATPSYWQSRMYLREHEGVRAADDITP